MLTAEHYRIAKQNGISSKTLYARYKLCHWEIERAITEPQRHYKSHDTKEFAIYKGEELIFIGTARECTEHLNISQNTFWFYVSDAHKKRVAKQKDLGKRQVIVRLDDEEDGTA